MRWPKIKRGLPKVDFSHIVALGDYHLPLSKIVSDLKFSAKIPNAKALASLFNEQCLVYSNDKPQLIIPIPLHKNRYLLRKFNQSIEIVKHISRFANIPYSCSILNRSKSTQPQTELTAADRHKNLRNAFSITKAAEKELSEYTHVVLFDDVVTTGTTVNMAFKLLRKLNPNLRIDVWSICITLQR